MFLPFLRNTARRVHLPGMEDTGDCQGEIYNTGKKSLYSNTFADKEVHDIQRLIALNMVNNDLAGFYYRWGAELLNQSKPVDDKYIPSEEC